MPARCVTGLMCVRKKQVANNSIFINDQGNANTSQTSMHYIVEFHTVNLMPSGHNTEVDSMQIEQRKTR